MGPDPLINALSCASVHVIATPMRRPLRLMSSMHSTRRWLRRAEGVRFSWCGRTSAGTGHRDISRTLSLRRMVAVVDWSTPAHAAAGRAALDASCREAGSTVWSAALVTLRSHGAWEGAPRFVGDGSAPDPSSTHVASLTCARVRVRSGIDFYLRSFPKAARQARSASSPMVAGLGFGGAVPLRDACTISFWPTSAAVSGFAYGASGAHASVQRASVDEGWLGQSLFARFAVVDHGGTWGGGDPLAQR